MTALCYAAFYGHTPTVKLLVEAGANVDVKTEVRARPVGRWAGC